MSATTVRCKFPVRRRDVGAVGETVVAPLRPVQSTTPPPSRAARMLALAHHVKRLIEVGELGDYAQAARVLGVTRARMTQVMGLVLLAPEIQERVLLGESAATGHALRRLVGVANWDEQLALSANSSEDVGS